MENSEKPIVVPPGPRIADPGNRPDEAQDFRSAPSTEEAAAPLLDRLIGELEATLGAAAEGTFRPARPRPALPVSGRSVVAHVREPHPETTDDSAQSEERSFEAVLDGEAWAVSLPEDEAAAEAPGRSTGDADQAEAAGQRATAAASSEAILPLWSGFGWFRRPAGPGAVLLPVGVGAVALCAVALAVVTSHGLPTVESQDASRSSGMSAAPAGGMAEEPGRSALEDGAEPEARLSKVEEPVTPRLVKTIRIREELDQASEALAPPALPAFANAGSAERLQAVARGPAGTDEALRGTQRRDAEADRWPSPIPVEVDPRPDEVMSAEDQAGETALPADPAGAKPDPTPGPAASAPDPSAAEADGSSAPTPAGSAQPTRAAATTTHVNMRAGPTSKAAVIRVVPAGGRVGVIGCEAWCEVVFESERGWIHGSFVAGGSSGKDARAGAADLRITSGTPLIGSDGGRIGTVRGEKTDESGRVLYLVELAQELGAPVASVWLQKKHFVSADEQARVKFTRARLLRSLPRQPGAEASRNTDPS